MGKQDVSLTGYPLSEKRLRQNLSKVVLDLKAFEQKLIRCELSSCRGMCCYDGVYVDEDAASAIQKLAEEEADFFEGLGLNLPEHVIIKGTWEGLSGLKTAVREHPFSAEISDYPAHFNNTSCVFRLQDGRCSLQLLSVERGFHRWYFKPFSCWLHPIHISYKAGIPRINLYSRETDPNHLENYDGFVSKTKCGAVRECGEKAHQVLREELEYLGKITDQDLLSQFRPEDVEPHY